VSRGELARHNRDVFSLMAGLLLVLPAGAFLVQDLTALSIDGRWVAPVVLLVVGVAGLLATLRSAGARSDR
jgi:hypothetical protein